MSPEDFAADAMVAAVIVCAIFAVPAIVAMAIFC